MADDLTTQILIEIRDGIHQTNERLDRTNDRLDRVVQEQIRHATAIVGLEKGQHELANGQREVIKALARINDEFHGLNERLDNVLIGPLGTTVRKNTGDIDDLRRRLEALEKRAG